MQLNPFKKSGAYYNGIKSKYDALTRQVESTTTELTTAKANYLQRNTAYQEMLEASKLSRSSPADRQVLAHLNHAESQVQTLEIHLRNLNSQVMDLLPTVNAPEDLKKVKGEIAALARHEAELNATSEKTQTQIEKFDERITVLEERILQETQIAAQSMLESEGDFVTPESLSKLDVELRIAQVTQKELKAKQELLRKELASLPPKHRELHRSLVVNRALVAEIDSREALLPVMKLITRAAITKRDAGHTNQSDSYVIDIPPELSDAVEAELASESSTS
jgi:chromosome segregation ATPase